MGGINGEGLCRSRVESDYRGGCGEIVMLGKLPPLSLSWEVHLHWLWDRLWLNDSSEAHVRKRISPRAGVPQRNGVKLAQASFPLSYFLNPPMFASITYWPHWAKQWFTPNWSKRPPQCLLFSSPFLTPLIIYSATLTSQPLAIPKNPPPMDEAKMSVVFLLSLPQLRWGPLAWQWEVNLSLSSRSPSLYPTTWKHVARWRSLLCGQQKHFSSWTTGSNRALHIGFVVCQNIWISLAQYSTISKAQLCYDAVWWRIIKIISRNNVCLALASPAGSIILLELFVCWRMSHQYSTLQFAA